MRRKQRAKIKLKICVILSLLLFLLLLIWINNLFTTSSKYAIQDIPSASLEEYFSLEEKYDVDWYYFAAIDDVNGDMQQVSREEDYREFISLYQSNGKNIEKALLELKGKRYKKKVLKKIEQFEEIGQVHRDKIFPLSPDISYEYSNTWGAERTYGGERSHEGIDIMADKGVPILSVGEGKVTNIGWNELGGWRVGIQGEDGIYYYYAHLDGYGENIEKGMQIKKGDVLGYVGNTGYGPEGTSGKFVDHLHFGMYENNTAINPYPFLQSWE